VGGSDVTIDGCGFGGNLSYGFNVIEFSIDGLFTGNGDGDS
jgi:hypothetical protein